MDGGLHAWPSKMQGGPFALRAGLERAPPASLPPRVPSVRILIPPPYPRFVKLRIKGDTLRLRLTQNEVARLAAEGAVEDTLHVAPGAVLRYGLRADANARDLGAVWEDGTLTVLLPAAWVGPWAEGDGVGFDGIQDAGDGRCLSLLVEKDFACLHEVRDEPDAYPNPFAGVQDHVDLDD